MKTSTLFSAASFALAFCSTSVFAQSSSNNVTATIIANAAADNITLSVLNFTDAALADIAAVYANASIDTIDDTTTTNDRRSLVSRLMGKKRAVSTTIIDVHTHVVPSWYQAMVPTTGQNPTPSWDISTYLSFMASEGINYSVFSFSAPAANVYPGNRLVTVALARLMNEQAAAYTRANPTKLSFYAVVPLPYVAEAIIEANYAIDVLGAAGIFLTSNFEGTYLGNSQFTPFFQAMNARQGPQILYVHPGTPYVKVNNQLVEANPTPYPTGNIEFFFETARTLMDLSLTQTIHNFTNINYIIPHVGGAFPACADRILKSAPAIYNSSMQIYQTRFWWDSAGPTYYHQVAGLLGYGIPPSQLLFGTDYPYAPSYTQAASLAAVQGSTFVNDTTRTMLFHTNPVNLFGSKINIQ